MSATKGGTTADACAVILAGGYGERFWPLSTRARPKQLIGLLGETTMLQMAVDRLDGVIPPERIFVLTSIDLVEAARDAAPALPPENVLGEPCRRDTGPAIALACARVAAEQSDGVFCVLAADHVIGDTTGFQATLRVALEEAAENDVLVTIGLRPRQASTGFGYIEVEATAAGPQENRPRLHDVLRFVEKPDRATAERYLETRRFWWNSGMFIWSAQTLRAALARHCPDLAATVDALLPVVGTPQFSETLRTVFEPLTSISVDFALMEKADNVRMVEGHFDWDDVGTWSAAATHLPADRDGNVVRGDAVVLDSTGSVIVSDGRLTGVIGVEDLIVVQSESATLVLPKDRAQDVKKVVTALRRDSRWAAFL